MTLETGKPIGKIFFISKKIFYLSSFLSFIKYSLLVRQTPFPLDHTEDELKPLRERTRYQTSPYTRRVEVTTVEDSEDLKNPKTLKIYWPLEDQTPVLYLR